MKSVISRKIFGQSKGKLTTFQKFKNLSTQRSFLSNLNSFRVTNIEQNAKNPSGLYLQSLFLLDYSNLNENIEDLRLLREASEGGLRTANLLLAAIAYFENSDHSNSKYRDYLKQYNQHVDWSDDEIVKSTIESYLKALVNDLDSSFAHYAIGKFYLKQNQYERALKAFTVSTEKMNIKAKYELALLLRNGSPDGIVQKNSERALELFTQFKLERQATKQLVEMYKNGEGTKASYSKAMNQQVGYYFNKSLFVLKIVAAILNELIFGLSMAVLTVIAMFFFGLHISSVYGFEFNLDFEFEDKETPNKNFSFKLSK